MEKILGLNASGLTGARVYMNFLQSRIQPLRVTENPRYKYVGMKDHDRGTDVVLSDHGAFHYVKCYMKKIDEIPPPCDEYSVAEPPPFVRVDSVVCYFQLSGRTCSITALMVGLVTFCMIDRSGHRRSSAQPRLMPGMK